MYLCVYVRRCTVRTYVCICTYTVCTYVSCQFYTVVSLISQSLKKAEGSVYDSPRAMAKLLKEAERVKKVLSANTDHYAQVSWLNYDIGFTDLCGITSTKCEQNFEKQFQITQ